MTVNGTMGAEVNLKVGKGSKVLGTMRSVEREVPVFEGKNGYI